MDAHAKIHASSLPRDGLGRSTEADVLGFFAWFQSFVPLKSAESASLFWTTCALHFFIISAFYCSSPVRDEVGVQTKQSQLPYFFAGTLLGTMIVNPAYSFVTAKYPLSTVVPWLYRGFAIVNLSFFFGMSGDSSVGVGWLFYVWVGVFALFNTSLFWSVASNTFDQEAATRLYGLIAAGGTLGQIFGSVIAGWLAARFGTVSCLLASALFLECGSRCVVRIAKHGKLGRLDARGRAQTGDQPARRRSSGGLVLTRGFRVVLRSPMLLGIAAYSFLSKMNSSFVYLAFLTMWAGNQTSSGDRVSFIASLNTYVGFLTLGCQLLGTGPLISRMGVSAGLGLLPLCILVGMSWIANYPTLAGISALKMAYSIFSYSVSRPSKEILYTGMDMEARFIGKNLLDLFITRAGDATAATVFGLIVRKEDVQLGNPEYYTLIHTGIVVAAAWLGLSVYLGQMFKNSRGQVHDHNP